MNGGIWIFFFYANANEAFRLNQTLFSCASYDQQSIQHITYLSVDTCVVLEKRFKLRILKYLEYL